MTSSQQDSYARPDWLIRLLFVVLQLFFNPKPSHMKKRNIKLLTFNKQDIADLTREEQQKLIGGNAAPTVGEYCTQTCGALCGFTLGGQNDCSNACTGACPSYVGGGECDPGSNIENVTCYVSLLDQCHTDQQCTYVRCSGGCPNSYNDATCKAGTTCQGVC